MLRVLTVAHAEIVTAIETPVAAGPLDNPVSPGQSADDYPYVILDAALDTTTGALAIAGHPGKTRRYVLGDGKLVRAP